MAANQTLIEGAIRAALKNCKDPYLGTDLLSAQVLKKIEIYNNEISLHLKFGFPIDEYQSLIKEQIQEAFKPHLDDKKLNILLDWKVHSHKPQENPQGSIKSVPGIKNIIAVASGKGGVGKSTTAINLALSIALQGARVGILDADIYGPSLPMMLGIQEKPEVREDKKLLPIVKYNLQSMSMGYLVGENAPMVWRGPMVSSALQQLLFESAWDNLDYLIVDLPPGTGDIQLTLAQKIPVAGAIIVTTPQDIALIDAKKAIAMFQKLNVSILGIVENMSVHICSNCGHQDPIFWR